MDMSNTEIYSVDLQGYVRAYCKHHDVAVMAWHVVDTLLGPTLQANLSNGRHCQQALGRSGPVVQYAAN